MIKSSLRSGFSLMELMIYIAIVGIMLAVVGPNVVNYFSKAKSSTTEQTLKSLKQAIELYNAHTSQYPESLRDLVRQPMDEKVARKWQGPYIEVKNDELPEDGWGREFIYRVGEPGSGRSYDLYSLGANGEGSSEAEWIRP